MRSGLIVFQRCRGFYTKFIGTVCRRFGTKRCLTKTRVDCLPVVHRRILFGTPHLGRQDDAVRQQSFRAACFISGRQWAHDVIEASALSESSDGHKVVIFHANPGCSELIESLLQLCDHQQIAWEPRIVFTDYLKSLTEIYNTKFAYCSRSFVKDSEMKILDEVLPNDRTTDATLHAKIFGNVPELYMLIPKLVVILSRSAKLRLCQFGIIEPILIVTGFDYRLLTEAEHFWQKSNYKQTAVYELLLRTELVKTVPLSAINHTKQMLKSTRFDYDRENFYIVKLSLRKDLDCICSGEDVIGMMLFLRTICKVKKRRVIPVMERLCPDSGIMLLELGISMMDRISDIPLNMWPGIYHAVKTSSGFSTSPLYNILQRIWDYENYHDCLEYYLFYLTLWLNTLPMKASQIIISSSHAVHNCITVVNSTFWLWYVKLS